jgi:acetyltransferase-like isoleucine patch superfamily enzyme
VSAPRPLIVQPIRHDIVVLGRLFPNIVKKVIQNTLTRVKYDVRLSAGCHVHKVSFEKSTSVGKNSEIFASEVGRATYIGEDTKVCFARIGRYCAIGSNVRICLGNHPSNTIVSIHPCFYSTNAGATKSYLNKQVFEEHKFLDSERKYVVDVGNDVWIGNDVSIMDGIKIGDGAILATGSIITHDVEPYSIVVGIPARHIKYRFTAEQIIFLKKFKWWDKDEKWLIENACHFTNIEKFVSHLSVAE